MEYENALELFRQAAALKRGRVTDEQRHLEPLFEVRLDAGVTDCEGWPIRSWRVRVKPSHELDSGLTAEDIHRLLEVIRKTPGSANIEIRLENSAIELY